MSAGAAGPRVAVLSHRRCGGSGLRRLLAACADGPDLGDSPFAEEEGAPGTWRAALAQGALFSHALDRHSEEFNAALLGALAEHGYRVAFIEREARVERITSAALSVALGVDSAAEVAALRARLVQGERLAPLGPELLESAVAADARARQWLGQRRAAATPACADIGFETLFRTGVAAIEPFDRLVAALGLGAREARLSEGSLLEALSQGAHHTLSLLQYSASLREAAARIRAIVAEEGPDAADAA